MLFNFLRIVLWSIISTFVVLKIRKTKIVRKNLLSLLMVVLCLGLISVSGMFPAENLFINFKSPESVFNYTNPGKINDVLYGKESCMVIYSNWNSTGGHYIIPKTEKGYKIPGYFSSKNISHKFDRNGSFDIYNVLGTKDYYVIGTMLSNKREQTIVDNHNDPVRNIVIEMGNTETKTVIIYSYVENFTNDYFLLFNGKKITITGQIRQIRGKQANQGKSGDGSMIIFPINNNHRTVP